MKSFYSYFQEPGNKINSLYVIQLNKKHINFSRSFGFKISQAISNCKIQSKEGTGKPAHSNINNGTLSWQCPRELSVHVTGSTRLVLWPGVCFGSHTLGEYTPSKVNVIWSTMCTGYLIYNCWTWTNSKHWTQNGVANAHVCSRPASSYSPRGLPGKTEGRAWGLQPIIWGSSMWHTLPDGCHVNG